MNDLDINTKVVADSVLALIDAQKRTPSERLPENQLFDAVCNLFEVPISNDEPDHCKVLTNSDG